MKKRTFLVTCALLFMLFGSTVFASDVKMLNCQSEDYQLPVINPDLLNSEEKVGLLSGAENTDVSSTFGLQSEDSQNPAFTNIPLDF